MDRDTARDRIADGLGFRTDLNEKIVLRMQEAQRNLERGKTLPWFLLEYDAALTLNPLDDGTYTLTLPERFLREPDPPWPFVYVDASVTPNVKHRITKKAPTHAFDAYREATEGAPQVYVLRTNDLLFYPVPDQSYSLLFTYYKGGNELTTNVADNSWLVNAPEVLIGDAGYRMASDLRNQEAKTLFAEMRAAAWDAIFRETIAREESNMRSAVGMGY